MTDKNFELNKPYWSYYVELTNACNKLKYYCGVFQVIPTTKTKSTYTNADYYYYKWQVDGKPNFPYPMNHNIDNRLNEGYNIFETREEAVKAHDKQILEWSKHQNTKDRATMIKKLINTSAPEPKKIEVDSIAWFKNLPAQEQKYVKWIKDYYEEI